MLSCLKHLVSGIESIQDTYPTFNGNQIRFNLSILLKFLGGIILNLFRILTLTLHLWTFVLPLKTAGALLVLAIMNYHVLDQPSH